MMKNLKEYIKNKNQQSNKFSISGIEVFVKDKLTNGVSARKTVAKLLSIIPSRLIRGIKFIKIGNFERLNQRKIQALYADNTILVTNAQTSESDFLDDLIHEVAHSVEELYYQQIYADKKIETEFIEKRKKLWMRLKSRGFKIDLSTFLKPEYKKEIDLFLHREVGYSLLNSLVSGIFYSAYASTSIREYFANGFEAYYMNKNEKNISILKTVSPNLFTKITNL